MENEFETSDPCQPEQEGAEETFAAGDTDPKDGEESTVLIKFNKETRRIPACEAAVLAQKGLKFDMISGEYSRLKDMALREGKSVSEFLNLIEKEKSEVRMNSLLDKCGGNSELAEHIKELEDKTNNVKDPNFSELQQAFPEIKEIGELPPQVLESAELHGRNLLDEYLRYLLSREQTRIAAQKQKTRAEKSSVGGLGSDVFAESDTARTEFLSGIWNR